jgi:hypothetical protein
MRATRRTSTRAARSCSMELSSVCNHSRSKPQRNEGSANAGAWHEPFTPRSPPARLPTSINSTCGNRGLNHDKSPGTDLRQSPANHFASHSERHHERRSLPRPAGLLRPAQGGGAAIQVRRILAQARRTTHQGAFHLIGPFLYHLTLMPVDNRQAGISHVLSGGSATSASLRGSDPSLCGMPGWRCACCKWRS